VWRYRAISTVQRIRPVNTNINQDRTQPCKEHLLEVKLKVNRPLSNEGERLYAEAYEFEKFGDVATALDRYRSMETLLAADDTYKPFVNLARRQIASIEENGVEQGEAARIIQGKLDQADESLQNGNIIAARKICL